MRSLRPCFGASPVKPVHRQVHDEIFPAFVSRPATSVTGGARASHFAHDYRLRPETGTLAGPAATALDYLAAFRGHDLHRRGKLLAVGIGRPFQKARGKALGRIKRLVADRLFGE